MTPRWTSRRSPARACRSRRCLGDEVFSGASTAPGGLLVRATQRAGDSTLQKIVRLVEEAQAQKAPSEQFVDRFSRVYTPVVVAVAVVLAVAPPLLGGDFGNVVLPGARAAHHRVSLRAGDLHARHGRLRHRGGLQARHPRQGRGGARGRRAPQGARLRQDGDPDGGPSGRLARGGAGRTRRTPGRGRGRPDRRGAGAALGAPAGVRDPVGGKALRRRSSAGYGLPVGRRNGGRG